LAGRSAEHSAFPAATTAAKDIGAPVLLIVWHSRTGAARAMAEAALEGARESAPVVLMPAEETRPDHLLNARGYLFVCPENLGSMSGEMKAFFDRTYYPVLGRLEGRAYATAIAAGSDGTGAERQIDRIVTGWRLRRMAGGLIVNLGAQTPQQILAPKILPENARTKCREMGQALAEGLSMGIF